jgi:hypothetical protein
MKRAFAHADSQSSEGADDKIYIPPFLRAPDHQFVGGQLFGAGN